MPDIFHNFQIKSSPKQVFEAISSPEGASVWWALSASGRPELGSVYKLDFGPGYHWKGRVAACTAPSHFEWELIEADDEWLGLKIGFHLEGDESRTKVRFYNTGWAEENEHFRNSNYCWAMYLRLLKRFVEYRERIPYEERLNV